MKRSWKIILTGRVEWNNPNIREVGCRRCLSLGRPASMEPKHPETAVTANRHPLITNEAKWSCLLPRKPYEWEQPRVVIVGAGVAGVVAAWRLHKAGIDRVVVLEALDRPGGRVQTGHLKNTKVDLGSSELYGCTITNPLYNISVAEGTVDGGFERKAMGGPYYTVGGDIVLDVERPLRVFGAAMAEAARTGGGGSSLKKMIDSKVRQDLGESQRDVNGEAVLVINGLENESRVRWGEDLDSLSADSLASCQEMSGSIFKLNKVGATKLLEPFLSAVGSKIRYKKPVQSIRWRSGFLDGSLRGGVLCCDGEEFEADFVLSTVSLGVLKAQAATLFSPNLPRCKAEAVERLGYGHVNKIYLEYESPFWAPSEGTIKVGWNSEDLLKRDSWLKGVGSVDEVSPSVLGVSVAGREAVWTESCSDANIAEELTSFLRKLTSNPALPCPNNILRSKWSSDIFFYGALSYLGLESSPDWQDRLASPLPDACCPVLLFGGDATTRGTSGSMTGATISGLREADRILEVCNRLQGPPRAEKADENLKPCPQTVAVNS